MRHLHPTARSLADVGAGTGLLVAEAAAEAMAAGIEPSRRLADTARSLGRIVLQGTLPHPGFEKRAFDLVTLVDVVEHVTEPVSVFRHCVDPVAGDGLVVVVTQMWAVPRR